MADPLPLLYRADWTQWSLSAKIIRRRNRLLTAQLIERLAGDMRRRSGGIRFQGSVLWASKPAGANSATAEWSQATQRLVLAPGGRYRFELERGGEGEDDDERVRLIVSDGEACWVIRGLDAEQSAADQAHPPFADVVRPTWLMSQLQLTTTGTAEVAGRPCVLVRGTPRLPSDRWAMITTLLDRVDMVVDAELGLVLRCESAFEGQPISSLEVSDLMINPAAAADQARFRPDDGVSVEHSPIGPPETNLYWRGGDYEPDAHIDKLRMARSVARGAAYLAARQLARPEPASPDPPGPHDQDVEAEMPASAPPAPAPPGSRRQVSDGVLNVIAHAGMAPLTLTADVHHWLDAELARHSLPALLGGATMKEVPVAAGFFGSDEENVFRWRSSHRMARLTLAMPDRYRIDFERDDRPRQPLALACDGELLRKICRNRVVASPPLPLPTEFVRLVDPAWLLRDWPLTETGEQTVNGRRAIALTAERPPVRADHWSSESGHSVLIALAIDAEMGIVLQQVSYLDDKPVSRYELRDVRSCEAIDVAEFASGIAPGLPVIHTDGEPIGDLDLPDPARAIGQAGADLVSGARSAFGWLASQARKVGGG